MRMRACTCFIAIEILRPWLQRNQVVVKQQKGGNIPRDLETTFLSRSPQGLVSPVKSFEAGLIQGEKCNRIHQENDTEVLELLIELLRL